MENDRREEKILPIYEAVLTLIKEGADINSIKVIDISHRAGIGKGTIYEYFDSKEEVITSALLYDKNRRIQDLLMSLEGSFENMIYQILQWIDANQDFENTFLYLMRIYFGSYHIAEGIRDTFREMHPDETMRDAFIKLVIGQAMKENRITMNRDIIYSVMAIAAQICTYAMTYSNCQKGSEQLDRTELRQYIYENILKTI